MLINGLKKHFPELSIIGEETVDYEGKIEFDYSTIKEDYLPSSIAFK